MHVARVEDRNGYPTLVVDGQPVAPMFVTTRTTDPDYIRGLSEAGVRVFFEECETQWLTPNSIEDLELRLSSILDVAPDTLFVLRLALHPPMEWIRANSDQLVTYNDGSQVAAEPHGFLWPTYDKGVPNVYSLHSQRWRKDAGAALEEFIDLVDASSFAGNVIGYFLAAGGTFEWYSMAGTVNRGKRIVGDASVAFREEFGRLLRQKYGTEGALRRVWNDPTAGFEHPAIPDFDSRAVMWIDEDMLKTSGDSWAKSSSASERSLIGSFLNPDTHQNVADFYEAWHAGTAESIIYFARIVRRKTGRERVVGAFYGSYGCTHFFETGTASGTLRILDSGALDFLAAPGLYENRLPRGNTAQREMQDSFSLRNMLFVAEEDTRTHLSSPFNRDFTGTHSVEDSIRVMKRDFGRNLCEQTLAWWFDMPRAGGWYDDPEIVSLIGRQQDIAAASLDGDRAHGAEIALIYDEESTRYVSDATSADMCHWLRCME